MGRWALIKDECGFPLRQIASPKSRRRHLHIQARWACWQKAKICGLRHQAAAQLLALRGGVENRNREPCVVEPPENDTQPPPRGLREMLVKSVIWRSGAAA